MSTTVIVFLEDLVSYLIRQISVVYYIFDTYFNIYLRETFTILVLNFSLLKLTALLPSKIL